MLNKTISLLLALSFMGCATMNNNSLEKHPLDKSESKTFVLDNGMIVEAGSHVELLDKNGIYKKLYDTDRPNITPWEMLGYSIEPTWWETTYGPAPYTKDNLVLWKDLEEGIVREPNKKIVRNDKHNK